MTNEQIATELQALQTAARWFVNDFASREFGLELPPEAVMNPVFFFGRGDVALVEINGTWRTVSHDPLCPERVLDNFALDEAWNRCHCQRGHARCLRTARPRQRYCGPCTPLCRCQCPACAYDPGATVLGETETELVHATTKQQAEAQILKTDRRCDLP